MKFFVKILSWKGQITKLTLKGIFIISHLLRCYCDFQCTKNLWLFHTLSEQAYTTDYSLKPVTAMWSMISSSSGSLPSFSGLSGPIDRAGPGAYRYRRLAPWRLATFGRGQAAECRAFRCLPPADFGPSATYAPRFPSSRLIPLNIRIRHPSSITHHPLFSKGRWWRILLLFVWRSYRPPSSISSSFLCSTWFQSTCWSSPTLPHSPLSWMSSYFCFLTWKPVYLLQRMAFFQTCWPPPSHPHSSITRGPFQ